MTNRDSILKSRDITLPTKVHLVKAMVFPVALYVCESWTIKKAKHHGLQHARFSCQSPTPGACSNSCPSSQWCHPTILSSVVPFSSCLQSFPASGSFPTSQLFSSGGQSIGVSTSASVLPINTRDWFPLGRTDLISLQSKRLSRVFFDTIVQRHQFFSAQLSCRRYKRCRFNSWVRRSPRIRNGNPLQYYCLENSMDKGLQSMGLQRVRHDWVTEDTHTHTHIELLSGAGGSHHLQQLIFHSL